MDIDGGTNHGVEQEGENGTHGLGEEDDLLTTGVLLCTIIANEADKIQHE